MKKIITVLLLLVTLSSSVFAGGVLIISQYYEGASYNKWIEISNVGDAPLNLTSPQLYLALYSNSAADDPSITSASSIEVLTGTLAPGATLVYKNSQAALPLYASGTNSNVVNFNGNDLIIITTNNSSVDGVAWANRTDVVGNGDTWGSNKSFSRLATDVNPKTTYNESDWTQFSNTEVDGALIANNEYIGTFLGYTPLPVELTTFSASIKEQSVELNWETATEVNNYGFDVERQILKQVQNDSWEKIAFVNGHGNSNSPKYYSFTDSKIKVTGTALYRLKQIDIDGTYEYSDVVEANLGAPNKIELNQNYPNPFNPTTSIQFNLPQESEVKLSVFNVLGEEVAELLNNKISAGYHSISFNGSELNSGIYFYKLESSNFTQIRKMMLVK